MWNRIRLVFPVIFAGIIVYHLYGYFSAPQPHTVANQGYQLGKPPAAFRNSKSASEPVSQDDESKLQAEFKKLCNVLVYRASQRHTDPPETLNDALAAVEYDWQDKGEKFASAFRILLDPNKSIGTDPWGQPCTYRVDRERHRISLHSLGPNRQDEEGDGDDILVTVSYARPGPASADDEEFATAEESDGPPTNRLPMIAGLTVCALVGGFLGFRVFRRATAN